MAAKWARLHRRSILSEDQLIALLERSNETSPKLLALLTRLMAWVIRSQWIYTLVVYACMGVFWFPLVETDYTRRCKEHQASLQRLGVPINFTQPCISGYDDQPDGFHGESWFVLFTKFCCSGAAYQSVYLIAFHIMLPIIEHTHRRLVHSNFCWMFAAVIVSVIFNQLASAFATRPLAVGYDLRFHSLFAMQLFGFALCVLASFMYGVKHALNAS